MEACEVVRLFVNKVVVPAKPRRRGNHRRLLRAKRYLIEQINGLIKNYVLKGCRKKPKGITKKTSMIIAGLIGLIMTAMKALLQGEPSLKAVSQHWA